MVNVRPVRLQQSLFLQENTNDSRLAVLAKDRTERLFVVHIVRIEPKPRFVAALPRTVLRRLPPGVRFLLVCRVYSV